MRLLKMSLTLRDQTNYGFFVGKCKTSKQSTYTLYVMSELGRKCISAFLQSQVF